MKQVVIRPVVAVLAFAAGLTCAVSFRAAISQHKLHSLRSYEAVLRDDLYRMRELLDQYAADRGRYPLALDDLVREGYMPEVPIDPMTGIRNWERVRVECPADISDCYVVVDIRSASKAMSSEGRPYSEW